MKPTGRALAGAARGGGPLGACQELIFETGNASSVRGASGFRRAQQQGEFPQLRFEGGLGAFAILEARFKLTFPQRQHIRADFECLPVSCG